MGNADSTLALRFATFDVYRGSQCKGQVRIQDVQEGTSSGVILHEVNPIEPGDS